MEMPRKKINYTDLFPFHIRARSNNREWFYVSKRQLWTIFVKTLSHVNIEYNLQIHAFVLMDNHYHLIATASKEHNFGEVMSWLQMTVSREVNRLAGRTNHVFGGPYRATLIKNETYYYHAIKYVYQNPLASNLTADASAFSYPFSTLANDDIPICSPLSGIASLVPSKSSEFIHYINSLYGLRERLELKKALSKFESKFSSRLSKDLRSSFQI